MPHLNIKLFARQPGFPVHDVIPVFHRWIQQAALPDLLIDVTDYSHVEQGPGVLLIGHEAIYGLDQRGGRLGLLYNRRVAATGPEPLPQAFEAAQRACRLLEAAFPGRLTFSQDEIEITWNDRLLHPNTDEGWQAVEPEVRQFAGAHFGAATFTVTRATDPRERLRAIVRL
jgi:hypothetical protein